MDKETQDKYKKLQMVRRGNWNTRIIYGFFIDTTNKYFEVSEDGDWYDELSHFQESILVQEKWNIKFYVTDFEHSVKTSEGTNILGPAAIIGIAIAIDSLTVNFSGVMKISNINDHIRKILDKFADINPCFKMQTPSLYAYTILNI